MKLSKMIRTRSVTSCRRSGRKDLGYDMWEADFLGSGELYLSSFFGGPY